MFYVRPTPVAAAPNLSAYATQTQLAAAITAAIPNLASFATDAELAAAITAAAPDLAPYASEVEMAAAITGLNLASYATDAELAAAIAAAAPNLSAYATQAQLNTAIAGASSNPVHFASINADIILAANAGRFIAFDAVLKTDAAVFDTTSFVNRVKLLQTGYYSVEVRVSGGASDAEFEIYYLENSAGLSLSSTDKAAQGSTSKTSHDVAGTRIVKAAVINQNFGVQLYGSPNGQTIRGIATAGSWPLTYIRVERLRGL